MYLIRHATPDWGRKDLLYHVVPGPPLTDLGKAEAAALGNYLEKVGVDKLYSSPLERGLHTAQIAGGLAGAEVIIHPGLLEWQPGEAMVDIINRFWPVFKLAVEDGIGGRKVGLVTHGGPIGALLEKLGMDDDALRSNRVYDHNNLLPPAGVWRATRPSAEQEWRLSLVFRPI